VELTPHEVRKLRASAQCLDRPGADLEAVSRRLGAVNAQSRPAMLLALRPRVQGLRIQDVAEAIGRRTLAITWLMRGTLHLSASRDLPWMLRLLGPVFQDRGRRRRLELGLTDETVASGLEAIGSVLRDGRALTRHEVVDRLVASGLEVERRGQAPIHLLQAAALAGIVCQAPERDARGGPRYVLLGSVVTEAGGSRTEDEALAELARIHLGGYGPATVRDLAAWSGLGLAAARRGWELLQQREQVVAVTAGGRELWALASSLSLPDGAPAGPVARLLPAFDTYVLGYHDRDLVVSPQHRGAVYHGGQTVPVVAVDGLAAGVWRHERRGHRLRVEVAAFEPLGPGVRALVADEAEGVAGFLGGELEVSFR
jgi:hypothetical protein